MVRPSALRAAIDSRTVETKRGERPSEGSSRISRLGRDSERAGDREHLLLAAGHGPRELVAPLGEDREEFVDPGVVTDAPGVGAERQVLRDGHAGEELALLGHDRDAARDDLVRPEARELLAVEPDRAVGGSVQAHDGLDERRLPCPVRSEDRHALAVADAQGEAPEDLQAPVVDVE